MAAGDALREALSWRADALCRDHQHLPWLDHDPRAARRWMNLVCALCPVREQCLAEALADPELLGIWAGTSQKQRIALRAGRPVRIHMPGEKLHDGPWSAGGRRATASDPSRKVCARCGIEKDRIEGFGLMPNGFTRSPCRECAAAEAMAKRDAQREPKYRWGDKTRAKLDA